ncbi:unnamed protein product [Trichogramma brassicae]|uniref:Uncharacterized protein n=1 Tax=Trichogramma brassicae TaxID=86971 RepID=A0A6H5IHP4_9HYME|nr:unnamed protein product [Trichogramma brassicae]
MSSNPGGGGTVTGVTLLRSFDARQKKWSDRSRRGADTVPLRLVGVRCAKRASTARTSISCVLRGQASSSLLSPRNNTYLECVPVKVYKSRRIKRIFVRYILYYDTRGRDRGQFGVYVRVPCRAAAADTRRSRTNKWSSIGITYKADTRASFVGFAKYLEKLKIERTRERGSAHVYIETSACREQRRCTQTKYEYIHRNYIHARALDGDAGTGWIRTDRETRENEAKNSIAYTLNGDGSSSRSRHERTLPPPPPPDNDDDDDDDAI